MNGPDAWLIPVGTASRGGRDRMREGIAFIVSIFALHLSLFVSQKVDRAFENDRIAQQGREERDCRIWQKAGSLAQDEQHSPGVVAHFGPRLRGGQASQRQERCRTRGQPGQLRSGLAQSWNSHLDGSFLVSERVREWESRRVKEWERNLAWWQRSHSPTLKLSHTLRGCRNRLDLEQAAHVIDEFLDVEGLMQEVVGAGQLQLLRSEERRVGK